MKISSLIAAFAGSAFLTMLMIAMLGGLPGQASASCGVSQCNATGYKSKCCRTQLRCEEWWVQPCPVAPPNPPQTDYEFIGNQQLALCESPFTTCTPL